MKTIHIRCVIFLSIVGALSTIAEIPPASVSAESGIAAGLFKNAKDLMNQELYEQAIADFRKIVSLYPGSEYTDDSLYLIGKYYYSTNDFEKSLESLNRVINAYANKEWAPAAYYLKAMIYLNPKFNKVDYKIAYANFSRIFAIYKESRWIDRGYFGSGMALYKLHQYSKAREMFHHVMSEFPNSEKAAEALYYEGLCFILEDHVKWALQTLQKVIDKYPGSAFVDRAKGLNTLIFKTRFQPALGNRYAYHKDNSFSFGSFKYDDTIDIAIDGDGRTVIANAGDKSLYTYDADHKFLGREKIPSGLHALFFTNNNQLVKTFKDHVVIGDKYLKFFLARKKKTEQLEKIEIAIMDHRRFVYLADKSADGILKYPQDDNKARSHWPSSSLKTIADMAVDPEGFILVLDDTNQRLIKLQDDGKVVGEIKREGSQYRMKKMHKVAVDPIGNIYLLDRKTPALFLFSRDLQFIQKIGLEKRPLDVAVNYRGEIFIINSKHDKIEKYR